MSTLLPLVYGASAAYSVSAGRRPSQVEAIAKLFVSRCNVSTCVQFSNSFFLPYYNPCVSRLAARRAATYVANGNTCHLRSKCERQNEVREMEKILRVGNTVSVTVSVFVDPGCAGG